jgi:hypothetical protein
VLTTARAVILSLSPGFGSVPLCSLKVKSKSDASGLGFVQLTEGEYHRRVVKELNGQPLNH